MKRICFFFLLVLANFYSFAQVDSFRPVYDEEKQDFYNRISRYKELSDAKIYFTSDIIQYTLEYLIRYLATHPLFPQGRNNFPEPQTWILNYEADGFKSLREW